MPYVASVDRRGITIPQILDEYISGDNPVRVIDAFVNQLDLEEIGFKKAEPATKGRPSYDPRCLLKLYVYGYYNIVRSSRKLMVECRRNNEVIWLLCKLRPDYHTIANFRKDNVVALKKVFNTFAKMCIDLGLCSKELVAIDGSKFRAVNAKDKNLTIPKLEKKLKMIEKHIDEYLKELDKSDREEKDDIQYTEKELKDKLEMLKARKEKYNSYIKEM